MGGEGLSSGQRLAGQCWTEEEFVGMACGCKHPIDMGPLVPDELVDCIVQLVSMSFEETLSFWAKRVLELQKIVEESERAELQAKEVMQAGVRGIIAKKNLVAWHRLLEDVKYEDAKLIEEVSRGFSLTGVPEPSGVYPEQGSPPLISSLHLEKELMHRNLALLAKIRPSDDREADIKLWEMTLEEINQGWLSGPFGSLDDLYHHVGKETVLSRRFPLRQGEKIRAIDDYSESGVNLAAGCSEKVVLHDADMVASLIRVFQGIGSGVITELTKSTGEGKSLSVHRDWKSGVELWGCTLDLSHAYKQLAVTPESWWTTGGAVLDTDTMKPAIFLQKTLPFGASLSVTAFNRCSRSLWAVGAKKLLLPWLVFFDDFPMMVPAPLAPMCKALADMFMATVGWETSAGEKAKPFRPVFCCAGSDFYTRTLEPNDWGRRRTNQRGWN